MIKLDYCQQQLLGVLLAEYPLLKEWRREEVYWNVATAVATTCQSGVFNSCVSLVATLAVALTFSSCHKLRLNGNLLIRAFLIQYSKHNNNIFNITHYIFFILNRQKSFIPT